MKMYIQEAIDSHSKNTGLSKAHIKKDLEQSLWPNSKPESRTVLMSRLCNGLTKNISLEFVSILCEKLNITPTELFSYER